MSNFQDIKRRLSTSTTMPLGTGGDSNSGWMMGSAHSHHEHKHDDSCCGHEHSHDHDEDSEDHTNPSGGCC